MDRTTARLLLRPLSAADFGDLAAMHQDPAVMDNLGGMRTLEQTRAFIEREAVHWTQHGFGLWSLRALASGTFIGRGGLRRTEVNERAEVEVAYALAPPFWGRGLATEMAQAAVSVAFDELGLPDLIGLALPDNLASRHVLEKVGFLYEGEAVHKGFPSAVYRLRAARR